jgi:hypothetical protein
MTYRSRNILYFLSKVLFWVALLGVCAYLLLSIAFYFIGQDQFDNLQQFILSHRTTFLIPVLLLVGWLGMRIFKDVEEQSSWRMRSRSPVLRPLIVLLLVGLAAYATYALVLKKYSGANASVAEQKQQDVRHNEPAGGSFINNAKEPIGADAKTVSEKKKVKDSAVIPPKKTVEDIQPQISKTSSGQGPIDTSTELSYKVASKAYFYNSPDESTRRNAFINHWNNSYATLYPKEDKNGFVYVIFTNEKGQTSMGWLRKKDLKPVKEIVYNSIK